MLPRTGIRLAGFCNPEIWPSLDRGFRLVATQRENLQNSSLAATPAKREGGKFAGFNLQKNPALQDQELQV